MALSGGDVGELWGPGLVQGQLSGVLVLPAARQPAALYLPGCFPRALAQVNPISKFLRASVVAEAALADLGPVSQEGRCRHVPRVCEVSWESFGNLWGNEC